LKVFLLQRLTSLLAGAVVQILFEPPSSNLGLIGTTKYFLATPWWQWDTVNYIHIAQYGYNYDPHLTVYLPLYPALIKLIGLLTNSLNDTLVLTLGALLITGVCYLLALFFMFKLMVRQYNEEVAKYSCLALAFFPMSFFYLMAYTEALFLLLVLSCFYYATYPTAKTIKVEEQTGANLDQNNTLEGQASKDNWFFLSCILAAVAALVRMQGILLVFPLLYLYYQRYGLKLTRHFWGLALIGVGPLLFQLYVNLNVTSTNSMETLAIAWHKHFALPIDTLITTVVTIFSPESLSFQVLNIWALLNLTIIVSLVWLKRRQLRLEYHIYTWTTIFLYLSIKADKDDILYSLERYLILIFPAFIAVGLMISGITSIRTYKITRACVFGFSFAFQLLLCVAFAGGLWLG
jgi:hypothetical protein